MAVVGDENYTVNSTFDLNNKLLSSAKIMASGAVETTDYTYDIYGNLTKEYSQILEPVTDASEAGSLTAGFWGTYNEPTLATYQYDELNRLTDVLKGGVRANYTYTTDDLRASQSINNTQSNWVWDGMNLVKDGDISYYYGIDLISSSAGNYYTYNAHGDVVALTDINGTITKLYDYDAFGVEKDIGANDFFT